MIDNKELEVLKGKRNRAITKVIDYDNLTVQFLTSYSLPTKINIPITDIYSDKGLTIKNYNIKALGNSQNMLVKVFSYANKSRQQLYYFNHNDLLAKSFLKTSLPKYVKAVLLRLVISLIKIPRKPLEPPRSPYFKPKKPILTLTVNCPLNKINIPISMCQACGYFIRYRHEYQTIKGKRVKVIKDVICKLE